MEKSKVITPIYLGGRYESHILIPFKNRWDGLGDKELEQNQIEVFIPESYYRAIGDDPVFPEVIDLDGGPFMPLGYKFKDNNDIYRIDKIDCRGKYPILICSKLQ